MTLADCSPSSCSTRKHQYCWTKSSFLKLAFPAIIFGLGDTLFICSFITLTSLLRMYCSIVWWREYTVIVLGNIQYLSRFYFTLLLKEYLFIYLFDRERERERRLRETKRDLPSADSFSRCLQQMGLGQVEVRISEFHSAFPCREQVLKYLTHHLFSEYTLERSCTWGRRRNWTQTFWHRIWVSKGHLNHSLKTKNSKFSIFFLNIKLN